MSLPNAAELAAALVQLEELRRTVALQNEVIDRLRSDVVRLDDIRTAQAEAIAKLEAIVRKKG